MKADNEIMKIQCETHQRNNGWQKKSLLLRMLLKWLQATCERFNREPCCVLKSDCVLVFITEICLTACSNFRVQSTGSVSAQWLKSGLDSVLFSRALCQCLRAADVISTTLLSAVYSWNTPSAANTANNFLIINQTANMQSNLPHHDSLLGCCCYTSQSFQS